MACDPVQLAKIPYIMNFDLDSSWAGLLSPLSPGSTNLCAYDPSYRDKDEVMITVRGIIAQTSSLVMLGQLLNR
jgi:hypothetical protein